MKQFTAIVILLLGIVFISAEEQKYSSKYDNFDLNSVLNNERILKQYVKCLLQEGVCTPEGRELLKSLPDAIVTECSKCNEKQKDASTKVLKFLNDKYPDMLAKLLKKYDPNGEYEKKYKEKVLNATDEPKVSSQ